VFDIDDTLFKTSARVKIVNTDSGIEHYKTSEQLKNYSLTCDESASFSEFKDAEIYCKESSPIKPMIKVGQENSGSMGPYLVTLDEIPDFDELILTTRVNGKIRQSDTHANMAYPIDFLISYLSTFITLEPGDVIYTGTPTGAGARFDPPIWLKPGDTIEVEANGIGLLINSVEDE
jgi:2-keto-4-pentenoate hydratase/2-oxohepta-3-ene-1,7-dioic acid hydratase in catechol pathway